MSCKTLHALYHLQPQGNTRGTLTQNCLCQGKPRKKIYAKCKENKDGGKITFITVARFESQIKETEFTADATTK